MSSDTQETEVVWKTDDLLSARWAVNDDLTKIVSAGFAPNKRAWFLVAIDLVSGSSKSYEIASMPSGIIFTSHDIAVASIGEELLKIGYKETQGWSFEQTARRDLKGGVVASLDGELVWGSTENIISWDSHSKVMCAGRTVSFPGTLAEITSHKGEILVLTTIGDVRQPTKGNVFLIDSSWEAHELAEIDGAAIIGSGSSPSGLWIATEDGVVRTFGRTEKKSEKIDLP